MLVLSRKEKQRIVINENIEVTIVGIRGSRVTLGIDAPLSVPIHRGELQPQTAPNLRKTSIDGTPADNAT